MFHINALKNLRVPVPVDPDDAEAGTRDVTGDHILSHFIRMGADLAKLRESSEYRENADYTKRSFNAPVIGGLVANPIQSDPVPQGETWEVSYITFFFPDSAAVSSTSYFARVYTNARMADQVLGMAEPPLVDLGNGVLMFKLPTPVVLHQGESIYADIGATVANQVAWMNMRFRAVHIPTLYKEVV